MEESATFVEYTNEITSKMTSFFGEKIKSIIGRKAFYCWLSKATYKICDLSNTFTIVVANERIRRHVATHYLSKISLICSELWTDRKVNVEIVVQNDINNVDNDTNTVVHVDFNLDRHSFESFIPDSSNAAALNAAKSVACYSDSHLLSPGTLLYIYGGVGHGKTHLCQAINDHYHNIDGNVAYFSAEAFTAKFVASVRNNTIFEFKEKILAHDILIIDDLHFLFTKKATLEELTNLVSNMLDSGKYVVFATTVLPSKLSLSERLRSRIFAGAIVQIAKASLELKQKIIKRFAVAKNMSMDHEVTQFIAQNVAGGIREIAGAINRLAISHSIHGYSLNMSTVTTILADMLYCANNVTNDMPLNIEKIKTAVCNHYGFSTEVLTSRTRMSNVVRARSLVMYLSRNILQLSYADIAVGLGIKAHATVIHGLKKARDDSFISEAILLEKKIGYLT